MALPAGTRLGRYEILAPLGAGGMGEVYRARDTRLGRELAIKVLPEEIADRTRLRRFEQEARAAAALNHPNVLDVHDIGTHDGAPYVVSELLEGQTLRARLVGGALPVRMALDHALQIAHGLAAAHDKGIVHRDLKPDNVFITEEGRVKVLDFGLAKLIRRGLLVEEDDRTTTRATESGTVMGTVGYMSPEQARGEEVDHRSDIFSFGAVLYEMLSGQRAFRGETAVETMNAILNKDPPPFSSVNVALPPALERIVTRCLEKRPKERFHSVRDVAFALEALSTPKGGTEPSPVKRLGRKRIFYVTAASVLVLLGALGWWLLSSQTPDTPAEPVKITPFTSDGGQKKSPRFSPDGEKVAYQWAGPAGDNWDIYVKALGVGTRPLRLTKHPAHDWNPVWSPDGRRIAFVRWTDDAAAVYTVPTLGGQEAKLIDIAARVYYPGYLFVPSLSWSPDGELLALGEKNTDGGPARIIGISLATLQRQALTSPPEESFGDLYPRFSPDGRQLAFVRSGGSGFGDSDLWLQPLDGKKARQLTSGDYVALYGLAWATDGNEILFGSARRGELTILRVAVDGGEPQRVAAVGRDANWPSSRGDRLVYVQWAGGFEDIWRVPGRKASFPDRAPEKIIDSSYRDYNQAYSPDGRRVAFASTRTGPVNVWVCASDGSDPIQLTSHESFAGTPRWSPDGRRIVFDSLEVGDWNLYVIDAEGGIPRQLTHEPSADCRGSWSRDGQWIYFASDRSGTFQTWKTPAEGGPAVQVTRRGGNYAVESWDGRHLYYTTEISGPSGIWRVPVDGGEEVEVLPGPVRTFSNWALVRDGIYFVPSTLARKFGDVFSLKQRPGLAGIRACGGVWQGLGG
jgi:Tol biopolymer transport system component